MMNNRKAVLALDLGTTTGWALWSPDLGGIKSGTWNLRGGRFDGAGMRFVRFAAHLCELHTASPLARIAYEEVRRHIGTDAAHIYGGLWGTLTGWCENWKVPYQGVPVGTIKKDATGKGNASKEQMIAAMREAGFSPADDNEADALALLRLNLKEFDNV